MGDEHSHEWLIVGCVIKAHGVHGDLVAEIITDFPERLADGVELGLGPADGPEQLREVFKVRTHKGRWLLSFKGIRDRDTVEAWRGQYLFLPAQQRDELPDGYYYEHELVGLRCRSPIGEDLGEVTGLDEGPGQVRLVIRHRGQEHLVPWVPSIIRTVDLDEGQITLDPPAGLLDSSAEIAHHG